MDVAMRARQLAARVLIVGLLGASLVLGVGIRQASAATAAGGSCSSLYDAATYAGDRYQAADRRGDRISADWWWSIYVTAEWAFVKAGCLNGPGGSPTS
jgi:hypothetical protein